MSQQEAQQQLGAPPAAPPVQVLLTLARDNKADELTALLKAGAQPGAGNKMGQTALHVAALWGNQEAARALLQGGADPNARNARGSTPLHFAAAAKRDALGMCELLLAAGADATLGDDADYLPYEQAESPEVRLLLGGPDQRLFDFAEQGCVDELSALLASGGAPSLKVVDAGGRHVLNLAIAQRQAGVVQLLLKTDPELAVLPDMTGNTPLHLAAGAGDAALVAELLARGAAHPGQLALDGQNLNMCEYSTGSWLTRDEAILPLDKTPLHLAVEAGAADVVAALLAAGANPNVLDYDGAAPLHLALEAQDEDVVAALLACEATNANLPGKDVTSALHAAAQRGPVKLLQLLLAHKADVRAADAAGWTPLHLAARAGAAPKVSCLLEAHADVAAANAQGNTPLHLAAVNGHARVVELLLATGADAALTNREGRSPRDMAKTPEAAAALAAAAGAGAAGSS